MTPTHRIVYTPLALEMLAAVKDARERRAILERISKLALEPEKQGKPLTGELAGYLSARAVAQRYRVVYRVERGEVRVLVVGVGLRREGDRRDIYALLERMSQREG